MRILITKNGNAIIKDLDISSNFIFQDSSPNHRGHSINNTTSNFPNLYKTNTKIVNLKNRKTFNSLDIPSNPRNSKNSPKKKLKIKTYKDLEDLEDEKVTLNELKTAKNVTITNKKIIFPSYFAEKYEKISDDSQTNNIINYTNNIISSMDINNSNGNPTTNNIYTSSNSSRKKYSFREIIPMESITKMKLKIIKDKKMRDRASRVTENDFRSRYTPETDIQRFNNILNFPKVSENKSSLIKYLNENQVDPMAVKTLYDKDNYQLGRANKMCQILLNKQEQDKLTNGIINDKLKHKLNSTKKDFQVKIKDIGKNMNIIKMRFDKYNKRIDAREKYRDIYNDMVLHHWNHYNFDRLNKKSTNKSKVNDLYNTKSFYDL